MEKPQEPRRQGFFRKVGAAMIGRRTRWLTLLLWLALAGVMGALLPSASRMESQNPANLPATAQSIVADSLQQKVFGGKGEMAGILVFYRKSGLTAVDYRGIASFLSQLAQHPLPGEISKPAFAGLPVQTLASLAKGRGSTLAVPLVFHDTSDTARLGRVLTSMGRQLKLIFSHNLLLVSDKGNGLAARFTGPAGIAADAAGLFKNADITLLAGTTMLILILLLAIYRSPMLPFIPLVAVGFAFAVTSSLLGALARAHVIVIDAETVSIMTVLMFGAGTDYTLLVVARYREQLALEESHFTALTKALSGAAGAVAMSAGTVMLALLALLFSHYGAEHRFAIPFALGVGMTALAALTLVPALLALLGRTAFYPFIPHTGEVQGQQRDRMLARAVTTRPWVVAIAAIGLLAGLAAFSPGIRTSYDLLTALPHSSQARQGYALLEDAYGAGTLSPVSVLVEGPGSDKDIRVALSRVGGVQRVSTPKHGTADGNSVAEYQVTLRMNPLSNAAMAVLPRVEAAARQALGAEVKAKVLVSGQAAQNLDSANLVTRDTTVVIPIVLVTIAVLLMLYLRSIIAAAYLIGTVILSFFASLGLGWIVLHGLLGVETFAGGLVLYAFVFLVALGEDYNIFMVSRIWQERRTHSIREAVACGMRATSSVITAAGLILAGTFMVLTGLPLEILLQFGVVSALGILIDTLIVRSLLVPAITALLGDRAFWPSHPQDAII